MNLVITLTSAGADTGPFNIFSDVDGYSHPFEFNASKEDLLAGLATDKAPNGTTTVKIQSANDLCTNYIQQAITSSGPH